MSAQTIRSERLLLVERLRPLSAGAWDTASLCDGWSVRHVLAHLVTPFIVSVPSMVIAITRHRSIGRAMDTAARKIAAEHEPQDLLDTLERNAPSTFRPPGLPLAAPLTDAVAHAADIRWALGDPVADWATPDRLRPVLDFLVSPYAMAGFLPPRRLQGVALVANDQSWSHGSGSVVEGPSLALAMAVLGRRPAGAALAGPGLPRLLSAEMAT